MCVLANIWSDTRRKPDFFCCKELIKRINAGPWRGDSNIFTKQEVHFFYEHKWQVMIHFSRTTLEILFFY